MLCTRMDVGIVSEKIKLEMIFQPMQGSCEIWSTADMEKKGGFGIVLYCFTITCATRMRESIIAY